jgi:hypothetical protein
MHTCNTILLHLKLACNVAYIQYIRIGSTLTSSIAGMYRSEGGTFVYEGQLLISGQLQVFETTQV